MLVHKINASSRLLVYLKHVNISNVSWIYKRLEQTVIMTPVEILSTVMIYLSMKAYIFDNR